MQRMSIAALGVCCVLGGCVKKATYDALASESQKQASALEGQLAEAKAREQSLTEALAEQKANAERQAKEIELLKADLEAARGRQVELQDELTAMVHDSSKLKSSIQEMRTALDALEAQRKQTEARIAEYKKLLGSFKALIDAGKLKVKVVAGRMIVELPSDVLFASGSIDLSSGGKASILEIGKILASMEQRQFQIEGHTDDRPIHTARFPSNWQLAAGRAISVAQILIEAGLSPTQLSAASFGEHRPVSSNSSSEGRSHNRRIEIVLVPDLSKVPGFEELNRVAGG